MKGCRTRSVQAGIPTQSVGMPARTLRVRQVSILLPTISAVILVAGRGASRQAFPRSAWECLLGRSASCKCQSSSRLSLLSFSLQDAERPGRHSHAPRGNDKNKFWTPESKIYLGRLVQNKLVYNDERRAWER
jgi:hypothetical protein